MVLQFMKPFAECQKKTEGNPSRAALRIINLTF